MSKTLFAMLIAAVLTAGVAGPAAAAPRAGTKARAAAIGTYTISDKEMYSSGRTNMHGSYTSVSGKTHAVVKGGIFPAETADFTNSYVGADWQGTTPTNAKKMQVMMTWTVHGVGVSASIPAGVSYSGTSDSVTWAPPAIANTWLASATRSASVHFHTNIGTFYSESFEADASVLIGSNWYYVQGS